MYEFKIINPRFVNEVIALTKNVFDAQVAPQYSKEGVNEFYKYITPDSFKDRLNKYHVLIGCTEKDKLIGILEIRNNNHISLFFVEEKSQGVGIGRKMFEYFLRILKDEHINVELITVNSSPNSVIFYEKLGFKKSGEEKENSGIRFHPMIYKIPIKRILTSSS